jgi:hypothetical protein
MSFLGVDRRTLKIPFARQIATGRIVEVGEVPSGSACACVCIVCGAGMVARKGIVNIWHFSHDPNTNEIPQVGCDISFESAFRLYAKDLFKRGGIQVITFPLINQTASDSGSGNSNLKRLDNLVFESSREYEDVKTEINGFCLEIFFSYKGRTLPEPPKAPARTGVLAIDVDQIQTIYRSGKERSAGLEGMLKSRLAADTGLTAWLYHPNIKSSSQTRRLRERSVQSWAERPIKDDGRFDALFEVPFAQKKHGRVGMFRCKGCGEAWPGQEDADRKCPNCKGHLLSSFVPDASDGGS